jgi:hypothetical protein
VALPAWGNAGGEAGFYTSNAAVTLARAEAAEESQRKFSNIITVVDHHQYFQIIYLY